MMRRMTTTVPRELHGQLLNRELSTVEYFGRLLELAADESLPLLERVKMCRFCSSNLDEFFMVRVAGLMDQAASGIPVRSADGMSPRSALNAIRDRVRRVRRVHGTPRRRRQAPPCAPRRPRRSSRAPRSVTR